MFYTEQDAVQNRQRAKREATLCGAAALPFLALAVVGFVLRAEAVCIAGAVLTCFSVIFTVDLRLMPVLRYGWFLREIARGTSHTTEGVIVAIGQEEVYRDGVYFSELLLNVDEELDEEGERRFLVDRAHPVPMDSVGRSACVTSQGNVVLGIALDAC